MLLMVFVSALLVVDSRHQSRKIFAELQGLEKKRDAMHEEWGRLQLEQGTLVTPSRVEEMAQKKLEMISPQANSIKLVRF
jgi:cell division protein FtsL